MENQTKISSKCTFIKQENASGGNCNLANELNSRLMKEKNTCNETKNESSFLEVSNTHVQLKNNCSIYFVKELKHDSIVTVNKTTNGNISRPIAPKSADSIFFNSGKRSLVIEPYKKRDDKRRATHNEVERRRRDKMNSWIFKLKELIPESAEANSQTDPKAKGNGADSKSQILIRACEYIRAMQNELKSLRKSLMENGNFRFNNPELETMSHGHEVEIKCEPSTEETSTFMIHKSSISE